MCDNDLREFLFDIGTRVVSSRHDKRAQQLGRRDIKRYNVSLFLYNVSRYLLRVSELETFLYIKSLLHSIALFLLITNFITFHYLGQVNLSHRCN